MDPRALADRERPALGARYDLQRGRLPHPHRRSTSGHGHAAEPGHQPAPTGRSHQSRRRATTSRPQRPTTTPTTQDQLTLPTPWVAVHHVHVLGAVLAQERRPLIRTLPPTNDREQPT